MGTNNVSSRVARLTCLCLGVIALTGAVTTAHGATVTFAQFIEENGTNDFVFTNNGSSATFQTVAGGSAVGFRFSNLGSLPLDLRGFQDATLTMNLTTPGPVITSGGTVYQPLSGTIAITRLTAAAEGAGSKTNLLTITFSSNAQSGSLNGTLGGSSASLSPTTPNETVYFSSDFMNFSATTQRNYSLSFSSIFPGLAISGSDLQSFTAAGSGTFASDPAPTFVSTPEPSTLLLIGGTAGAATVVGQLRRKKKHSTSTPEPSTFLLIGGTAGAATFVGRLRRMRKERTDLSE